MNPDVEQSVQAALAGLRARPEVHSLFLVACGGSFSQMHVAKYAVDREARSLVADSYTSAEFVMRALPRLGAGAAAIFCSSSGNTPETVAAAQFARAHGAYTIGLTTKPQSPLAQAVDCPIGYESQPALGSGDAVAAILLRLTFGLLRDREGNTRYEPLMRSLPCLPELVEHAQAAVAPAARRWAEGNKRAPIIYTLSSGPNYGVMYSFSLCLLQEMQWIHSQPIHAGEYFHGPFEITDFDVPFLAVQGLGPCRKMDTRAITFAKKFSRRVEVIDLETLDLSGIVPEMRDFMQPLALLPVVRTYAMHLAEDRGHPLTVRRYMWKMDY